MVRDQHGNPRCEFALCVRRAQFPCTFAKHHETRSAATPRHPQMMMCFLHGLEGESGSLMKGYRSARSGDSAFAVNDEHRKLLLGGTSPDLYHESSRTPPCWIIIKLGCFSRCRDRSKTSRRLNSRRFVPAVVRLKFRSSFVLSPTIRRRCKEPPLGYTLQLSERSAFRKKRK